MSGVDAAAAAEMATLAGELLVEVRARGGEAAAMKDAGDRASQACLAELLAARYPGDAVLSEEAADDSDRLTNRRVWIIDPLDGTREFSEPPRDDWAVHVALVEDGALVVGAVALPAMALTLSTAGPSRRAAAGERSSAAAGQPHPTDGTRDCSRRRARRRTGPDGLGRGQGDGRGARRGRRVRALRRAVRVGLGGARRGAPRPRACTCSRLDGSPLVYNQADPWLPDVLICRPELADTVIATCRTVVP